MVSITLPMFCFFNDTATTEIYTLSLHDALPIFKLKSTRSVTSKPVCRNLVENAKQLSESHQGQNEPGPGSQTTSDRKSTRLNSSHTVISYAVFCLKKKKQKYDKRQHKEYAIT